MRPEVGVGVPTVRFTLFREVAEEDVCNFILRFVYIRARLISTTFFPHLMFPQPASAKLSKELQRLWRPERCEVGFLHDEGVYDVAEGSDARFEEVKLVIGQSGVDNAAELLSPSQLSRR